jgi:hypothetical protein
MVDKAIIIENKIKEMEKNGKQKLPFQGWSSESKHEVSLASATAFLQKPEYGSPADAWIASPIPDAATELPGTTSKFLDVEASIASTLPKCAATISLEHTTRPSPNRSNLVEHANSRKP